MVVLWMCYVLRLDFYAVTSLIVLWNRGREKTKKKKKWWICMLDVVFWMVRIPGYGSPWLYVSSLVIAGTTPIARNRWCIVIMLFSKIPFQG